MPTAIEEKAEKILKERLELQTLLAGKFDKEAGVYRVSGEEMKSMRDRNAALDVLAQEYEAEAEIYKIARENDAAIKGLSQPLFPAPVPGSSAGRNGYSDPGYLESLGVRFAKSAEAKANRGATKQYYSFEDETYDPRSVKTTMTEGASYAPPNNRLPMVIPFALRRPVVADLIPDVNVNEMSAIRFMEETTFTNNAAPVAENAAKPESALAFTERTWPIEVIATFLPVTNQQLDDVPTIRSIIDDRLTLMLKLAEEYQLLSGTGSSPSLHGYYNEITQTLAQGTSEPMQDVFYRAMIQIMTVGFANPTGIVMHPLDWQTIRLMRASTGQYLWGDPSEVGPERMWGLNVIATVAATQGTGLVGDFGTYAQIYRRMGARIDVGWQNDDFIKNKQTIRIEERLANVIYRKTAFCLTTGLHATS